MAPKYGFKRKPHYSLKEVIGEWRKKGEVNITFTGLRFAVRDLGIESAAELLTLAQCLKQEQFKKSVPSWSDEAPKEWHDHYHLPWDDPAMILLVKITRDHDGISFVMVSLKEKGD